MVAWTPPWTLTASSLLHQGAVKAGGVVRNAAPKHVQAAGTGQQAVQHGHGKEIRMGGSRGAVGNLDIGGLAGAFHHQVALASLGRLRTDAV